MKPFYKKILALAIATITAISAFSISTSAVCASNAHSYQGSYVKVEPTCYSVGKRAYVCYKCGYEELVDIPKTTNHTLVKRATIMPKCAVSGYDVYTCSHCPYIVYKNYVPAIGHSLSSKTHRCTRTGCAYAQPGVWVYMFKSIDVRRLMQPYGYYLDGSGAHHGIDIIHKDGSAKTDGLSVYSSYAGVVAESSFNSSCGEFVKVIQDNGYTVRYLHFQDDSRKVSQNQSVTASTRLGLVGSTGLSTTEHLHYDVKLTKSGAYVSPVQLFPYMELYIEN